MSPRRAGRRVRDQGSDPAAADAPRGRRRQVDRGLRRPRPPWQRSSRLSGGSRLRARDASLVAGVASCGRLPCGRAVPSGPRASAWPASEHRRPRRGPRARRSARGIRRRRCDREASSTRRAARSRGGARIVARAARGCVPRARRAASSSGARLTAHGRTPRRPRASDRAGAGRCPGSRCGSARSGRAAPPRVRLERVVELPASAATCPRRSAALYRSKRRSLTRVRAIASGTQVCLRWSRPCPGECGRCASATGASARGTARQRLVYCGALRARFRPYFLRSFIRGSRVRKPAWRSGDAGASGSTRAAPGRCRGGSRRPGPVAAALDLDHRVVAALGVR